MEEELNILKHELVPKQIILKDEEKKELLKKLNIIPRQLPKIFTNDPVVKSIGAKEGDIIKIIRDSPTAGLITYYRVVVKKV